MYLFDLLMIRYVKYMLLSTFLLIITSKVNGFNYADEGPDSWLYEVSPLCGGQRQSPIDIQRGLSMYDPNLHPIKFIGYDTSSNFNVSNNGHTVQFTALNNDIQINGSDFVQTYTLIQFHFHWGENNFQGSEHMIDDTKYPLELHLIHKASNGDLAVLGVLFDLSDSDNSALNSILDMISVATNESFSETISLALFNFLPTSTKLANYYRYTGSLTTPPCTGTEGVVWTIFEDHIPISKNQMASFHANIISKNFRYTQKLNSRGVSTSMKLTQQLLDYQLLSTLLNNNSYRLSMNQLTQFSFIIVFFTYFNFLKLQ